MGRAGAGAGGRRWPFGRRAFVRAVERWTSCKQRQQWKTGWKWRRQPRQLQRLWRTIAWRRILRWWVLSTAADTEYRFYRSWRRG